MKSRTQRGKTLIEEYHQEQGEKINIVLAASDR